MTHSTLAMTTIGLRYMLKDALEMVQDGDIDGAIETLRLAAQHCEGRQWSLVMRALKALAHV